MNTIYPYDDDFMRFDELSCRYVLTEKALISIGMDVRSMIQTQGGADPTPVINRACTRTSELIYGYIHSFSTNNAAQDRAIATIPAFRGIIYRALIQQAEYYFLNGDLSRSPDVAQRSLAIDESAKETLATVVPGYGMITYAGG